jgi:hypothetical protein
MPNANQKVMLKKNGCAIFLNYFPKVNPFPFLQVQTGVNMLLQSREKTPKTTLSALGKGVNLNCLP